MSNHRVSRIAATILAGMAASVVAEVTDIAGAATTSSAAAASSLGLGALIATSVAMVTQSPTGVDHDGEGASGMTGPRCPQPHRAVRAAPGSRCPSRSPTPNKPPVIFVHGGSGISDMKNDVAALSSMFIDRDLYVYDQIGGGASARLPQMSDYTLTRSIADLAAVRAFTGADQVVLIGHSWGARIVTGYLAVHPETVAAAILAASGPPPVATRPGPCLAAVHVRKSRPVPHCVGPTHAVHLRTSHDRRAGRAHDDR